LTIGSSASDAARPLADASGQRVLSVRLVDGMTRFRPALSIGVSGGGALEDIPEYAGQV
jgi:hypothetical protein